MDKSESREAVRERRAHWREVVELAKQSGQPPRQFCLARGLDLARSFYWCCALRPEVDSEATRFALVLSRLDENVLSAPR